MRVPQVRAGWAWGLAAVLLAGTAWGRNAPAPNGPMDAAPDGELERSAAGPAQSGSALLRVPANEGAEGGAAAPVAEPRVVRGSLFHQATVPPPRTANDELPPAPRASFMAVTPQQPKKHKKNDLITIVVSENSDASSIGKSDSSRKTTYDLALQQFLQANLSSSGMPTLGVVGNPSKLPEVKINSDNERTNDASSQRTDTFTARITAEIVDVKPNGNLVLQATKKITVDREVQIFRLAGVCRAADVQADNTVLSTQIAELALGKFTEGEVRDGSSSNWLGRFMDKYSPF